MTGGPTQHESRALGFWLCLSLCIGTFIGSGIFLLPAQLAPYGWNALFAWLITIGGALCLAQVFARLTRALPEAAGPYAFVGHAFGPGAAFTVAWSYWISAWVGNAAIAAAAISYLSLFAPALTATPAATAAAAIALLWLLTLLNCVSLRAVGGFQLVTVIIKLIPLLVVIGLAAYVVAEGRQGSVVPLRAQDLHISSINAAAALTLWALLGVEAPSIASRTVRDPERTIPRATLIGTALVGLIYILVSTPIAMFLPADQLAGSDAPFALFVAHFWDPRLALLIGLFAAISCIGALNGLILIQGELPLAMARNGAFPLWFARTSRRGTATRSILLSSGLASVLILARAGGSVSQLFVFMILLSTAAALILYLACALAALRLQQKGVMARSATMSLVAGLAALYSVWTLYGAGYEATAWGAALMGAGIPVYFLMRRSTRAAKSRPASSA
ncbi:MAG: basic amino acid/polyamine antiporter, family [Sphingomonadales bacterium]|jgi:APA family basic amino acid/polyamine antiporter|nr:basic amino acid/polyamine antiporter, family [Sphingomonadales bacterium]